MAINAKRPRETKFWLAAATCVAASISLLLLVGDRPELTVKDDATLLIIPTARDEHQPLTSVGWYADFSDDRKEVRSYLSLAWTGTGNLPYEHVYLVAADPLASLLAACPNTEPVSMSATPNLSPIIDAHIPPASREKELFVFQTRGSESNSSSFKSRYYSCDFPDNEASYTNDVEAHFNVPRIEVAWNAAVAPLLNSSVKSPGGLEKLPNLSIMVEKPLTWRVEDSQPTRDDEGGYGEDILSWEYSDSSVSGTMGSDVQSRELGPVSVHMMAIEPPFWPEGARYATGFLSGLAGGLLLLILQMRIESERNDHGVVTPTPSGPAVTEMAYAPPPVIPLEPEGQRGPGNREPQCRPDEARNGPSNRETAGPTVSDKALAISLGLSLISAALAIHRAVRHK